MPAACAYTYGCPVHPDLDLCFSLFISSRFTVLYLFISVLNPIWSTAAKKRENSRKDEGPTGIGAQYKQGINVVILVGVIII